MHSTTPITLITGGAAAWAATPHTHWPPPATTSC